MRAVQHTQHPYCKNKKKRSKTIPFNNFLFYLHPNIMYAYFIRSYRQKYSIWLPVEQKKAWTKSNGKWNNATKQHDNKTTVLVYIWINDKSNQNIKYFQLQEETPNWTVSSTYLRRRWPSSHTLTHNYTTPVVLQQQTKHATTCSSLHKFIF